MFSRSTKCLPLLLLALLVAPATAAEPDPAELTTEQLNFFEAKIRPVLVRECYACHSNKTGNLRGGLRLDTKDYTREGGDSGPAIVPGDVEESLLYNAITHQDFEMPPKRKLPQKVIDDFRKWIDMGAPDPRVTKIVEIKSSITAEDIQQAKNSFWAYQPPTKHSPPKVENSAWPRSDIDRFVLAKLEQAELPPTSDAEPTKLLRRLCFDLVGLPPTPSDIAKFLAAWKSDPENAISDAVDRLLASDQFGERWGRHWLDVVRYAESTGNAVNMTYPHAWRYRDYVIDSFNADKPYDQFVQEQLAGDLLPTKNDQQWADNLVATGFLAIGTKNINEKARAQFAADIADEQIDATTRVFLGTSVACARCHDHKFDAIPQTDYYAMAGIFRNMNTYFGNPAASAIRRPQARQASSLLLLPIDDPNPYDKHYSRQELADLKYEIADKQSELVRLRSEGASRAQQQRLIKYVQMGQLYDKLSVVDDDGNPLSYCMGVQESSQAPRDTRLLVRGEIDEPGQVVPRGFPQLLCDTHVKLPNKSSGRLELAQWIGNEHNPLTARVMVNRIWQHLLGQGLVTSPDNFGVTGQAPSHPELLDTLAVRFVESGWSVKQLIREIATSRVYLMDTTFNESFHNLDPQNALLWRAHPRRLDAEAIRDAMLAISGELDLTRPRGSEVAKAGYVRVQNGVLGNLRDVVKQVGGREMLATAMRARGDRTRRKNVDRSELRARSREAMINKITSLLDMEEATYRSVYLPIVRDATPRSLLVFDFADSNSVVGSRDASNTADQALYLMNNPFVIEQSHALAKRIEAASSNHDDQIKHAFLLTFGREPTTIETGAAEAFTRDFAKHKNKHNTLAALCQSLFASAEFRYVY